MNPLALVLLSPANARLLLLLLLACWPLGPGPTHCLVSRQELGGDRQLSRSVGSGTGTSLGALASLWGARTLHRSRRTLLCRSLHCSIARLQAASGADGGRWQAT